jgi:hypothetical protein
MIRRIALFRTGNFRFIGVDLCKLWQFKQEVNSGFDRKTEVIPWAIRHTSELKEPIESQYKIREEAQHFNSTNSVHYHAISMTSQILQSVQIASKRLF